MGTRLQTIPKDCREWRDSERQLDFAAGVWNDDGAREVNRNALYDAENVEFTNQGKLRGIPGSQYISGAMPYTNNPLAIGFIPKAADGNAYFIGKVYSKLYYCTHNASTPAYFLEWTEITDLTHVVDQESFTGSGLDDMENRGNYTGTDDGTYEVVIDGTGTPDTFKWRKDDGAWTETVAITGSAQTLAEGVQVIFAATTGHTLDDKWTMTVRARESFSLNNGARCSMSPYNDGLMIFDPNGIYWIYYDQRAAESRITGYRINGFSPGTPISVGTESGDYYRDYVYTLAKLDKDDDQVEHESGAHSSNIPASSVIRGHTASAIGGATTQALSGMEDINGSGDGAEFSHVRIWCTKTYKLNADGQVSNGVDRTKYIFNQEVEMGCGHGNDTTATDNVTDETLRARETQGLTLKHRHMVPMPNATIGAVVNDFIFIYDPDDGRVKYSSLTSPSPKTFGFYLEDQWMKTTKSVTKIIRGKNRAVFLTPNSTEAARTNAWTYGGPEDTPVPIIQQSYVINPTIGVPAGNVGTVAPMSGDSFIAATNDGGIRVFDGYDWGNTDHAEGRFRNIIEKAPAGAVGVWGNDKYYYFYPTTEQNALTGYCNKCLVMELPKKRPARWVRRNGQDITNNGNAMAMPPVYVGAITIQYQGKDMVTVCRRHYGSNQDLRMYWIDTFDSNANDIFAKTTTFQYHDGNEFQTSQIIPYWESRDWVGFSERHRKQLDTMKCNWSIDPDESAYLTGFAVDLLIYNDGTSGETIEDIKTATSEDESVTQSWSKETTAMRFRWTANRTGFIFRNYEFDYDERFDQANYASGRSDWITNQENLATNQESAASSFLVSDLGTASGGYYTSGKIKERVTANYLDFVTATGEGKFKQITGPDSDSDGAMEVYRSSGSGQIGFREAFASAFTLDTAFSIMAWAKTDSTSYEDLLAYSPATAQATFLKVQIKTTKIKIVDEAGNYLEYSGTFSSWAHIALVLSGGSYVCYINGTATTASASSGTLAPPSAALVLLIANPTTASKMIGFFEPIHYSAALTAADVLYHYNDVNSNNGEATVPLR